MKQIKTIYFTINHSNEFDRNVNETIAEGWTLVERKVLMPQVQPTIGNLR